MNEEGSPELGEHRSIKEPRETGIKPEDHFFWGKLVKPYLHEIREEIKKYV